MSRRRGEFEHRTSIFEGAFRAWSHLGGIEPLELETKSAAELDPLNYPILDDPRLAGNPLPTPKSQSAAPGDDGGDTDSRRFYPYEALPRTGLSHPFVQAILSPWLGPDADQDAVQLGLTTLRTWWQHRRKGESGSAIAALRSDKMSGVVEGYTRHFFTLAHCLVVNDGEQAPRTLMQKLKEIEKKCRKSKKKESREEDANMLAAMAMNTAGAHGLSSGGAAAQNFSPAAVGGMAVPSGSTSGACCEPPTSGGPAVGSLTNATADNLTPLERFAASTGFGPDLDPATGLAKIELKSQCVPGKIDLPNLVQKVNSRATQLAHRGAAAFPNTQSSMYDGIDPSLAAVQSGQYGDPTKTPVVFFSENGDIQIMMNILGITCAHCVKIVETVLTGCGGMKSPIDGLLDAAADRALNAVLIKIDRASNAKRIAFESSRNLALVGYTAEAKEMNVGVGGTNGFGRGMDMGMLSQAFGVVATTEKEDMFDWTLPCTCPDNGVLREDCLRHSQMNKNIFVAFDRRQEKVQRYISGCGSLHGMPCTCGPDCRCLSCDKACQNAKEGTGVMSGRESAQAVLLQIQQQQMALQQQGGMREMSAQVAGGGGTGSVGVSAEEFGQLMGGSGAADLPGSDANKRRGSSVSFGSLRGSLKTREMSLSSEMTFGRAMSGLSALSIDWENMEDFDVNVDHSAHITTETGTGRDPFDGIVVGGGDFVANDGDEGLMQHEGKDQATELPDCTPAARRLSKEQGRK